MEARNDKTTMRKRRAFTAEFKAGAVRRVLDEGQSRGQVARDLDLTPSSLGNWVAKAKADAGKGPPGAVTSSDGARYLQKAAAFFASEST